MIHVRRGWSLLMVGVAGALLCGCATTKTKTTSGHSVGSASSSTSSHRAPAPMEATDACASQLHDLCGDLLLYFATHHDLPAKLEELGAKDTVCPVSGKPYIYNPNG